MDLEIKVYEIALVTVCHYHCINSLPYVVTKFWVLMPAKVKFLDREILDSE